MAPVSTKSARPFLETNCFVAAPTMSTAAHLTPAPPPPAHARAKWGFGVFFDCPGPLRSSYAGAGARLPRTIPPDFARDACYSADYARTLPSGQSQMLLADVVVGQWVRGGPGIKMCPTLPGEQFNANR